MKFKAILIIVFISIYNYEVSSNINLRPFDSFIPWDRIRPSEIERHEELKEIASSCAGVVAHEVFYQVYDAATKASPHEFLFCALHPKKGQPFCRKNCDPYLFLDVVN